MASGAITSWQIDGETMETVRDFIFLGSKSLWNVTVARKLKAVELFQGALLAPWKKICDKPRQHIKKQRHYFANKGLSSQGYCFSCGHVWM